MSSPVDLETYAAFMGLTPTQVLLGIMNNQIPVRFNEQGYPTLSLSYGGRNGC